MTDTISVEYGFVVEIDGEFLTDTSGDWGPQSLALPNLLEAIVYSTEAEAHAGARDYFGPDVNHSKYKLRTVTVTTKISLGRAV